MLSEAECEQARQARDPRFDGRFFVGVLTTGIYCRPVCPVRIPIPDLLTRLRYEGVRKDADDQVAGSGSRRKPGEAAAWNGWAHLASRPALYRSAGSMAAALHFLAPDRIEPWTDCRSAPKPAPKTLHQLVKKEGYDE